ncbi:hypothetical protein A7A76_05160 [Lysobacter enzymogenes]|nr:hypothetical protein [Lysobacter enzymogenes]
MGTRRGRADPTRDGAMRDDGTRDEQARDEPMRDEAARRGGGPVRETAAGRARRRGCAAACEGDGSMRSGGMGL